MPRTVTSRPSRGRAVRAPGPPPRMTVEASLHAEGWVTLASLDEVGRGALCGPVTVGAVIVRPDPGPPPRGLRDSKLLAPELRVALVPRIQRWVQAWSVAHATNDEIDAIGIIGALRLAGRRAIAQLPVPVDGVLLDGNHDYLSDPPICLPLDGLSVQDPSPASPHPPPWLAPPVRTHIKADLRCASVAAASVLAKTTRDALMIELAREHPEYGWSDNKGYAAPAHRRALREHGPTAYHRRSWRLGLATDRPGAGDARAVGALLGGPVADRGTIAACPGADLLP